MKKNSWKINYAHQLRLQKANFVVCAARKIFQKELMVSTQYLVFWWIITLSIIWSKRQAKYQLHHFLLIIEVMSKIWANFGPEKRLRRSQFSFFSWDFSWNNALYIEEYFCQKSRSFDDIWPNYHPCRSINPNNEKNAI